MTYVDSLAGSKPTNIVVLSVAVLGIGFIASCAMLLSNWIIHPLRMLGSMYMTIYLAHILAASGIRIILAKALHIYDFYIHAWVGTAAGVLLPIALHRLATQRRFSWLFVNPFQSRELRSAAQA